MFKKPVAIGMVSILILAIFSSTSVLGTSLDRIEEIMNPCGKNLMEIYFSNLNQIEEINEMDLDILGLKENTILAFLEPRETNTLIKKGFLFREFDVFQEMEKFGFSQRELYDAFLDYPNEKDINNSIKVLLLQASQRFEEMENLDELKNIILDIQEDFSKVKDEPLNEKLYTLLYLQEKRSFQSLQNVKINENKKEIEKILQSDVNIAITILDGEIKILESPKDLDSLIDKERQSSLFIQPFRLTEEGNLLVIPLEPITLALAFKVLLITIFSLVIAEIFTSIDLNGDGKGDIPFFIKETLESYGIQMSYEQIKSILSFIVSLAVSGGISSAIQGAGSLPQAISVLQHSTEFLMAASLKILLLFILNFGAIFDTATDLYDKIENALDLSLEKVENSVEKSTFKGVCSGESGVSFNYTMEGGNKMCIFYSVNETVALREPMVKDPNGREIHIPSESIKYLDSKNIEVTIKNPIPGQWTIEIPPAYDGKDHYVAAFVYSETVVIPTLEINSFVINNNDVMTDSVDVTLTIDAPGATEMRFKNDGGNWTAWENYSQIKSWKLRSEAGPRTVYCEVHDDFDNIANASDSITLQFQGPSNVSITINNGEAYTSSTNVTLTITATGATEMSFSNDNDPWTAWEPFGTTRNWTLESIPGNRTVRLRVRDENGTIAYAQDSITLDMLGPTNVSITINNGEAYTSSTNVTLTITATGATEMSFNNDNGSWTAWEPFRTSKSWTLRDVEGERTVYLRVRDSDLNEVFDSDSITYQKGPRDVSITINNGEAYTSSTNVTLTITATGATEMRLCNDGGSWTAWESFKTTKSWTLRNEQGTRTVDLQVRDSDYNVADAQDSIVLNIGPEINYFRINNGDTYCSTPDVTLTISATGATEMCFRNDSGSWTAWEPYRNRTMWTLNPTQGTRNVEMMVRDSQGNDSSMQDSIILVLPDLTVSSSEITFSNNNPVAGETIWITMTVHNIGGAGYPEGGDAKSVTIYVYEGHPNNYNLLCDFSRTLIPAGDSYEFTTSYRKEYAGCFDIYVVIDRYGKIVELNESNNQDFNTVCFSSKLASENQYRSASDILIREHENIRILSDGSTEVENAIYLKSIPGTLTLTDSFPSTYQIIESSAPYTTTSAGNTTYISWTVDTTSISEIIYTIRSTTDSVTSGLNVSFNLSPLQISNNYHGKLGVQVNIERQDQKPSIVKFTVPKENEFFVIESISCDTAVILEYLNHFEVSIQTGLSTYVETNFLELSVRTKGTTGSTPLLNDISAKSIFFNDNFMGSVEVIGRDSLYVGSYDIETMLNPLDISISSRSIQSPLLEPDQIVLEGIEEQGKSVILNLNVTNIGSGSFEGIISAVADNFITGGLVTPRKLKLDPTESETIQVVLSIPQDALPSIYEGKLTFFDTTGYSMNVPIQIFVYEDDFIRFLSPTTSRDFLFVGMTQRLEVVTIDEDDDIVPGTTVTLSGCGIENAIMITDVNGKATFSVEPSEKGEITILAEKDDYVSGSKTIIVKVPTNNAEQQSSFLMQRFRSLASYNIERAELLKSEAYQLLQNAKDLECDLSEIEEILENADSSLGTARDYFNEGNYIAANFWAIQAIKDYEIVIEMLEEILGNAHDYLRIM